MSYPGVDPGDVQTMNPVGTQEHSSGEPQKVPADFTAPASEDEVKAQVAKAVSEMFTVDSWKPKDAVRFKLEFPSGQVALLRHLGTMDLIEYDLVEELDFFARKLFPASIDPSGNPIEHTEENETLMQALRDPEKRRRFMELTGKLVAAASIDPKVIHDGVAVIDGKVVYGYQMTPEQQTEHLQRTVPKLNDEAHESYSGAITFEDRMALFHELNKPLKMIEPFRPEQDSVLQNLAGVEGHGSEAV